ncbi:hypothetical protein NHF48_000935 [Sphingomonas sp. H160509]|uniref:hypothetical protein n=1 Tax=Sphingomonas sp. H160509 TaxID=2955313 RepID=UPI0020974991|nr:hypothetical protein [Sphingomonas sp. H160509]MDD1449822.1 hypothetical protein [Sphingomonas sp. H160509]
MSATPSAAAIHPSEIWSTVNGMVNGFLAMLPLLATGIVVFLVFWGASRCGAFRDRKGNSSSI